MCVWWKCSKIKQQHKKKNFVKPQHYPATAENIIGP